ncbi:MULTISPECIES: hypothetical protein [Streptomyces]|uniref:hypothetical protein n=1 Tax=Streptomyces TaxID=1883 RepID=UPI0002F86BE7|nr:MULTISPECIES: hypothetical protein [Streptomyces]
MRLSPTPAVLPGLHVGRRGARVRPGDDELTVSALVTTEDGVVVTVAQLDLPQ